MEKGSDWPQESRLPRLNASDKVLASFNLAADCCSEQAKTIKPTGRVKQFDRLSAHTAQDIGCGGGGGTTTTSEIKETHPVVRDSYSTGARLVMWSLRVSHICEFPKFLRFRFWKKAF